MDDYFSSTNLRSRSREVLCRHGIKSLVDAVNWSVPQLMKLRGVGKKTVEELRMELATRGLSFSDEPANISAFSREIASILSRDANANTFDAFHRAIEAELIRISKRGTDMKKVALDDQTPGTLIILISGLETCRFTVETKLKVRRR